MTLKFATAGAGYIANIHAQAIKALHDAELVAVVEKFSDKATEFAVKFEIERCYENIDNLLKDVAVDALVICTPNFLHAPQAVTALERGIHVLVEKPMAMNAYEAEKILSASRRSGAVLMVAHCWRFDRDVLWLKEQLQSGVIGRIIRTRGYGVHTLWGPGGWFTQKQFAGGGALADIGIHALDTVRFLLGDPQPVSVYAHIGTYYRDFDVDDTGIILVNWDNGVVSYIESGWWQPHSDGPEAATQLYGTSGFAQLFPTYLQISNAEKDQVEKIDPGFEFPRPEHCPQVMYDNQMAHFVDFIRTGKTPIPDGMVGLVNMKIVDAAYESARSGKVVKL